MHRTRHHDRACRSARALLAAGLVLAVLVPSALGGVRFAWCIPMARAQLSCCCHDARAHAHARAPDPAAPRARNTCCEGRGVAALPASGSAQPASPVVLPAAYVAFVTLDALHPEACAVRDSAVGLEDSRLARAGPAPPLFALNQSYLC